MKAKKIILLAVSLPPLIIALLYGGGVGKRKLLTMDEVLRLPITEALVIVRGKKLLQVDKCDYSRHPNTRNGAPARHPICHN